MTVIGIDPGIERTGIGIIKKDDKKLELVYHTLIKTSSKTSHFKRLKQIYDGINKILYQYAVDHASIEKLFFAKNVKTAMSVAEARGVISLAVEQSKIPIYEYTPLQVKQALTGYGRGSKAQIQELVKIVLNLDEVPKPDDVADGIALAITHINTFRTMSKINDNLQKDYLDFRR